MNNKKRMYGRFVSPLYTFTMIIQSLFSLLTPIGLMLLAAFALNNYAGVGAWIYVVLILIGVFSGLFSMISFILKASAAMDALEKQHREKYGETKTDAEGEKENE